MYEGLYSPWCYGELWNEQNETRSRCRNRHCKKKWQEEDEDNRQNFVNLGTNLKIVQIGEANGGDGGDGEEGGDGGNGGDGGVVTNVATVEVDNIVVIVTDNKIETDLTLGGLGLNRRQLDLKTDDKGNVFINGKKMNETQLDNGAKVFVFKDGVSKSTTVEEE